MLMKGLQDRVMSLATIHRGLYQTTGVTDIRADELLTDIVRQIVNLATGPGRRLSVKTDFEQIRLTPDQAVPLSLLLTEALTNAMKYAGDRNGSMPRLSVSLTRDKEQSAVLTVMNSIGNGADRPDLGPEASTGFGMQLLNAFGQQLGGQIEREDDCDTYTLRVTFQVRPLADAEQRTRANDADETAEDAVDAASAPEF